MVNQPNDDEKWQSYRQRSDSITWYMHTYTQYPVRRSVSPVTQSYESASRRL